MSAASECRAVLFDTETTGLAPLNGDRIVEIAALELVNDLPTGQRFHALIDPERDIASEVSRVHGITNGDVVGKPLFADVAQPLTEFFADSKLIAHNAPFDLGFLDMEFARVDRAPLCRSRMIDTLVLAKAQFPGMPNSLDALCRRFSINLSARTSHNALLDCELLAKVYIELTGARQRGLSLVAQGGPPVTEYPCTGPRTPNLIVPTEAEGAHQEAPRHGG